VGDKLTWTHYRYLLPIKDENKRNYYINLCIKNNIIIELKENEEINTEHDLEVKLLSKLSFFFNQLGEGFTLVDSQYKISCQNKDYYIDILLFNIELNCYVVVELKLRELRKEDKAQIEFYMNLINENKKKPSQNNTLGIIISKEQDRYVANFVGSNNIIPLTYQISK
jgi:predicted nuclease of restriction endonuclease-like (RecB) superfamily